MIRICVFIKHDFIRISKKVIIDDLIDFEGGIIKL